MSSYTKEHYEDVARIFKARSCGKPNCVYHSSIRPLVEDFIDLFAADNPPFCNAIPYPYDHDRHDCVEGGFDPKQFLAACGLEPSD